MFLVYVFFEINNTTEPNVAEFTGEWVFHCMFLVFMSFEINITTEPKDNRTGLVECTLFIDSANSTENTSTPSGFMIMNYIRPQLRPTPKECIPCVHAGNF